MSKIAFIFPGQGAQTMLAWDRISIRKRKRDSEMFEKASEILGLSMT